METLFSRTLIQLRKEAGFPTAYRFYHSNGGKNVFKLSYRGYMLIETGRNLPVPERLGVFIWALRLVAKSEKANMFVNAWLRTMMGEENFREYIEPLMKARPDGPELSPMQKAMKKDRVAKTHYLTLEQIAVIHADPRNYLCFIALSGDTAAWSVKDLAGRLALEEAAAAKALKALAGGGLVKEVRKGVYKCPFSAAFLEYPQLNTVPEEIRRKMRENNERLAAEGQKVYLRKMVLRADALDFRNFFPIMDLNVTTADSYAVTEKTDHSALFMVEGAVTKLRDF